METANAFITDLDLYTSLAHVFHTSRSDFVVPKIRPMGTHDIVLRDARHPCVEMQDDVEFIPNDCCLERFVSVVLACFCVEPRLKIHQK